MKRYGLLGRVLTHSFSQAYFSQKFAAEGVKDCVYQNFELPIIEELPALLQRHPDLRGLNVTIPYKEAVLPYLTTKDEVVNAVGACNCIRIERGNLHGFNTDVVGFEKTLSPHLKPQHMSALVLGTGGAAKAVCYVLRKRGIAYKLVSRSKGETNLSYTELTADVLTSHLLIVNTTPLGTFPNVDEAPPLPYDLLTPQHLLFDLVYNPPKTKFLAEGEKRGAQIVNGYGMLVEQAEESWRLWGNPSL